VREASTEEVVAVDVAEFIAVKVLRIECSIVDGGYRVAKNVRFDASKLHI
jgi:hypothetical protein